MRILATALVLTAAFGHLQSLAADAPPTAASAASKAVPADTVDQKRVHSEYGDGNFETVTQILEDYRAKHEHYRVADSVFIAKYLGVVYAANPNSREKGKYWLYKMLQMDPAQDLVDLYVGEEVQGTFEKVRSEFIVRRNYRGINDTKLNKAVAEGEPKRDIVVQRDTVVVKDNYLAPITDGIKGGYDEVKGGIKAGIQAGYVPIKEEVKQENQNSLTGNLNVGAGLKFMSPDWKDIAGVSDQTEFRVTFDLRQRKWPINIAAIFSYGFSPDAQQVIPGQSDASATADQTINIMEVGVGVRKIFDFRLYSVRPFFGGGFGYINTEWNLDSDEFAYHSSNRQGKTGIWMDGGVYWELDSHFNIGLAWTYSWAEYFLYQDLNHGGQHVNMILGFHF